MWSAVRIVVLLFLSAVNLLVVTRGDVVDVCDVCRCVLQSRLLECDDLWMRDEDLVDIARSIPKNMTSLSFSGNQLTRFPPLLRRMTEVRFLNLSRNVIELIPENLQETFPLLEVLDISANRIGFANGRFSENSEILERVSSLKELYLRDNFIKTVNTSVFRSLLGLTHLDLSSNMLEDLPHGFFHYFTSGDMIVNLGNNAITEIGESLFAPNQTFKRILLDHNRISSLHENSFDDVIIDELSLDFNMLSVLPMVITTVSKNVSVYGNPLECDCQLYKIFRRIITITGVNESVMIRLEGAQCATPFALKGFGFLDFGEMSEFMCPRCNFTECPTKEGQCYTCGCANSEQRGTCIRENITVETCECTSYVRTFINRGRISMLPSGNASKSGLSISSWILIGVIGSTVVLFLLVSFPMHYYCRRRIHKRQLRRFSLRNRLLSKSSNNNNNDDSVDDDDIAVTSNSDGNENKTFSSPDEATTSGNDRREVFELEV